MSCETDPGIWPLTIRRGIAFGPYTLTLGSSSGGAYDLTGCSLHAEIKTAAGDSTVIKDLNPTITSATAGQFTIYLTDAETNALAAGDRVWDLVLENASGVRVQTPLAGPVTVEEGVTTYA